MDDAIRVLPDHVVDQIAAGEVIERPASVVKELVDNAIDAGARTISIETTAGGRGRIRVVDDGSGMSPGDATLALARHATSKLRAVEDLWGLATMGFRGEALPSIASVSRLILTTRRRDDLAATRIAVQGGRLDGVAETGAPAGTSVEVSDLFYNVPARLKFLKAEATEAAHVTELVARIAMAHPELHVVLRHNGRTALDAPPDRDGFARAQALLGARVAQELVAAHGEETGVRVTAFLGAPELAQTTARGVQIFVGRRPVRDRGVLHAIAMGYGERIARGRYPVAIVLLDLAGGEVDVNVHPQKAEVRFSDPGAVAAAVRHVVQAGVARAPWRDDVAGAGAVAMTAIASVAPPRLPFDGPATTGSQTFAHQLREARAREWARENAQARLGFEAPARSWARDIKDKLRATRAEENAELAAAAPVPSEEVDVQPGVVMRVYSREDQLDERAGDLAGELAPGFFGSLRYLGQLDLTYFVCEAAGELVLIDQHVAHERVELARLRAQGAGGVATQRLLFPSPLDVRPELAQLARGLTRVLARAGFEISPAGDAVIAVPSGVRHADPQQLLSRLLESWSETGAPSEAELVDRVLAEIACHSVVRAGDRLEAGEAEALLRQLDGVDADTAAAGPHDRPVLLRLPLAEIARRFGR